MIAALLRDGSLVAPFSRKYETARGYFAIVSPQAAERDDVTAFVRWLADEAARESGRTTPASRRNGARPARVKRDTRRTLAT